MPTRPAPGDRRTDSGYKYESPSMISLLNISKIFDLLNLCDAISRFFNFKIGFSFMISFFIFYTLPLDLT